MPTFVEPVAAGRTETVGHFADDVPGLVRQIGAEERSGNVAVRLVAVHVPDPSLSDIRAPLGTLRSPKTASRVVGACLFAADAFALSRRERGYMAVMGDPFEYEKGERDGRGPDPLVLFR